jgi:predicted ATP-grasp superfamily ATP-dependent carboligase
MIGLQTDLPVFSKSRGAAVVLGLGINGLAIVRSLAEKGVEVWGVYTKDSEFGRFSRYCDSIRFPSLEDGENNFLQKLIDTLGNREQKPVLYTGSDELVMFMSRNSAHLEKYFRFVLPDHEILESLTEKNLSASYVSEKGLTIPKTYIPGGPTDIKDISQEIGYPCLLKPVDSFTVNLGRKNMTFSDEKSLREFLQERPDLIDHVVIQQIIPGGDSNICQATTYVSSDGGISPIFTMRKIRQQPPEFGITSYGVSETIPEIKEIVSHFLTSIQYIGFASLEFKQHPMTGEWFFIELNPRLPYYHSLIRDSGINFPYMYYEDMLDMDPLGTSVHQQKNGILWMSFDNDSASF